MFHFEYALLISPFFLGFMLPVTVGDGSVAVGGCMGVKHSDIQEGSLETASPNPLTAMSSLAPSAEMDVDLVMVSPVSGCRSGSVLTSWHISVSRFAVTSRISL